MKGGKLPPARRAGSALRAGAYPLGAGERNTRAPEPALCGRFTEGSPATVIDKTVSPTSSLPQAPTAPCRGGLSATLVLDLWQAGYA